MCGIVGFTGASGSLQVLVDSLKRLEYRGYDSAGLAVQDGTKIDFYRAVGKIAELERKIGEIPIRGTCGIAHTRWATHGEPPK